MLLIIYDRTKKVVTVKNMNYNRQALMKREGNQNILNPIIIVRKYHVYQVLKLILVPS